MNKTTPQHNYITMNAMPFGTYTDAVPSILLLHGYLETIRVWHEFACMLSMVFHTIPIDLPGHGGSSTHPVCNEMELMADGIEYVCKYLNLKQVFLVGHSMGGYAALAYAKKYAQRTAGLCLMHSTPNDDSDDKVRARTNEIVALRSKRDEVIDSALQKLFAPHNLERMQPHITTMKHSLRTTTTEGIIACQYGMMLRPNMNKFLQAFAKPLLLVFGKHDLYLPAATAQQVADSLPQAETAWMTDSGHCSFLEEPDKCAITLIDYFCRSFNYNNYNERRTTPPL